MSQIPLAGTDPCPVEELGCFASNTPCFSDFVDVEKMGGLLAGFHAVVGITSAILDLDGNVLVGSTRSRLCLEFHQRQEIPCSRCIKSDTRLVDQLDSKSEYTIFRCENGLTDAVAPIEVEGKHIADFVVGPFFLASTDLDFFRKQALPFGFDESDYLAAVAEIPILAESKLCSILHYLVEFAKTLAEIGLKETERRKATAELSRIRVELEQTVEQRTAALSRNEARFRAIFDQTSQLMGVLDVNGTLLDLNQSALRFTGLKKKSLLGKKFDETPFWNHSEELGQKIRDAIERGCQGEPSRFEGINVRPDGEDRDLCVTLTPILDPIGNVLFLILVAEDVTEIHRASEMLRRTQFAVDHQSVPTVWVDASGRFRYVNDAYARLVHYEKSDLLRMTVQDIDPKYPKETWEKHFEDWKQKKIDCFESLQRTAEGIVFPVEIHTNYFDFDPKGEGWICTQVIDIRERKQAEEKLKLQQVFLEAVLENIEDGIVACDAQGNLTLFNRATRLFHDIDQENIPPDQWAEHYDLYQSDGITPMSTEKVPLFRAYQGERVQNQEFVIASKNGPVRTLLASGRAMTDERGEKLGAVISMHDVTDLKRTEERLRHAKERAESANRAKSAFLANMSHELRTPLNAILGFTQLMERDPDIPPSRREELGIIGRSGRHLLGLINDVLDIAKIEAGHVTLASRAFDLYLFLRGIAEMFHSRSRARNLNFIQYNDPDLPQYVKTDEGKLRQILINLLGNAVKFTERGQIRFRVLCVDRAVPKPNESQDGTWTLRFEVEDTGPGIPEDRLEQIFEPFIQANAEMGCIPGTGLGLAISRQYIELIGGTIDCQSELGKGSVFCFDIPVQHTNAEEVGSNQILQRVVGLQPNQPPRRILVVEDRVESRLLLRKLLESVGFDVEEATNGDEAVERFRTWQPDLVWMDIQMPVMDGIKATRKIKQTAAGKHTPVIALTAHAFEEERQEFLETGCDDFVRKPYQESEIFEKMTAHLGVEYIYQDTSRDLWPNGTHELTASDFEGVSTEIIEGLHHAAIRGSINEIEQLIAQIEPKNSELVRTLSQLTENFAFHPIMEATETVAK